MQNILVLWLQTIIFCVLIGGYTIFMPSYFDMNYFVQILIIVLVSVIIFSFRKKPNVIKGNYFTSTFLFLLSFLIVHFQFYIDYALGLRTDLGVRYYLNYSIVPKAITIAALTVNVYFIGNIVALMSNSSKPHPTHNKLTYPSLLFLKITMALMLLLYVIGTPSDFFLGSYNELMNEEGALGYIHYKSEQLFHLSFYAYIISIINILKRQNIQISTINYIKFLGPFAVSVIGLFLMLNLMAGSRSPIIAILLALASGYFISQNKKLKFKTLIIILLIVGTTFQFLTYFRATSGQLAIEDRIVMASQTRDQNSSYEESTIMPATFELAGSIRAYHAVVMRQEDNDILYGQASIGYLLSIIPGLGLIATKLIGLEFTGSPKLVTEWMGADHGMGTTALADTYLDYGLYGTFIIYLLFGYLLSKLDIVAYTRFLDSNSFLQVLTLVFISNSIFISRASIMSAIADVVTTYIILKIAILIGRRDQKYRNYKN